MPGEDESQEAIVNEKSCLDGVETIEKVADTTSRENIDKEEGSEGDEEEKLHRDGEVFHGEDHINREEHKVARAI